MNYLFEENVNKEKQSVEQAIPIITEVIQKIFEDGIGSTIKDVIKDVLEIATRRKTITELYVSEARERTSSLGAPAYVISEAVAAAKRQAGTYDKIIQKLQDVSSVLINYSPDQFSMNEDHVITFKFDLTEYLKKKWTKELSKSQMEIYKKFTELKDNLNNIQDLFLKAGIQPTLFNGLTCDQIFSGLLEIEYDKNVQLNRYQPQYGRVVFIKPNVSEIVKINI